VVKASPDSIVTPSIVDTLPTPVWSSFWQNLRAYAKWDLEWNGCAGWVSVKSDLQIVRDYPQQNKCKITLIFDASNTGDYRLTFGVEKHVLKYVHKVGTYNYTLEYDKYILTFDWSDVLGIPNLQISHGIKKIGGDEWFWFRLRRNNISQGAHVEIDPTIIAENTGMYATAYSYQRKLGYQNGRFWSFYSDSTNMTFKTSTNGYTWTDTTTVRPCTKGTMFSVYLDGTYIHYTYAPETLNGALVYRKGTTYANGTITWVTSEQTVYQDASKHVYEPTVCVDSNGYPFVGFLRHPLLHPFVIKSLYNNGTWQTATGFPYELSTVPTFWYVSVIPLTSSKVYAVYARDGAGNTKGKLWNGTSWGEEETITSLSLWGIGYSTVSEGDNVHFVFLQKETYNICYVNRTSGSGWGSEQVIGTGEDFSYPTLTINGTRLVSFWAKADTVYYAKYDGSAWQSAVNWFSDSISGRSLNAFYNATDNELAVLWTTNSPYKVMFKLWGQYSLNLRTVDASNNPIVTYANISITYSGTERNKIVDSNGWFNWTNTFIQNQEVTNIRVSFQNIWVNGTWSITMDSDKTINVICNVYSLTVYITDIHNEEKSGASMSLSRDGTELNGLYGLPSSPTASYYNETHARYVWGQLANQTSSYTVSASLGGQTASSSETTLTANTEIMLTLPGGTKSPSGDIYEEPWEDVEEYLPPVKPVIPPEIEEYLPYGAILVCGLIIGIPVISYKVDTGKSRSQRLHGSKKRGKQRKKMREAWRETEKGR